MKLKFILLVYEMKVLSHYSCNSLTLFMLMYKKIVFFIARMIFVIELVPYFIFLLFFKSEIESSNFSMSVSLLTEEA